MVHYAPKLFPQGTQRTIFFRTFEAGRMADVEIRVGSGDDTQTFNVPRAHICNIPFFKNAFESTFKEGIDQAIYLPDESPASFRMLIEWLYSGWTPEYLATGMVLTSLKQWIDFYIMVDKWNLRPLVKEVFKFISNLVHSLLPLHHTSWTPIVEGYKLTQEHPIRFLFVHIAQMHCKTSWPDELYSALTDTAFEKESLRWLAVLTAAGAYAPAWNTEYDMFKLKAQAHVHDKALITILFDNEIYPDMWAYLGQMFPDHAKHRPYLREFLGI